ncbi:hypothetical protein ACFE04_007089 [Oxalis oulophora]
MESVGVFVDGEWDSFSRFFSNDQEVDFTSQLLNQSSYSLDQNDGLMNFMNISNSSQGNNIINNVHNDDHDHGLYVNSNLSQYYFMPQGNNNNNNYVMSDESENQVTNDYLSMSSMDICAMDDRNHVQSFVPNIILITKGSTNNKLEMEIDHTAILGNNNNNVAKELQLKRKFDMPEFNTTTEAAANTTAVEVTKKPRVQRNARANKKNANVQSKKKGSEGEEISNGGGSDRVSTSSHSSEEDIHFPETSNGETSDSKILNLNGKTRANRGEAKDPQSLYARKRRERINERLRILQNLVPNGTKVDISTMLEDAVHYVKFLQLQIKLLSSDDMWMYAPICYNGIDVGLNQKLSALL